MAISRKLFGITQNSFEVQRVKTSKKFLNFQKSKKSSFIYTYIWVENACHFRGFGGVKDTF